MFGLGGQQRSLLKGGRRQERGPPDSRPTLPKSGQCWQWVKPGSPQFSSSDRAQVPTHPTWSHGAGVDAPQHPQVITMGFEPSPMK